MSLIALAWAWKQQNVLPQARLVLLALADHHNGETGRCDPSVERLAGVTRLSRRQVLRHLAHLEEIGLIERGRRNTGMRRVSNSYQLCLERHLTKVTPASPTEGDTHVT